MQNNNLPIAIIGGGPVGLAAAAHLAQKDLPFILFETGQSVGQNFLSWGHVRVFSPWKYNIDKAARTLLLKSDWIAPYENDLPTGNELVKDYFRPLAKLPEIAPNIHYNTKVLTIGRKGLDKMKTKGREERPFSLKVIKDDNVAYYEARAVLDATGTWNQPNPIGSGGIFAQGELESNDKIYYGIPDVKGDYLERYKNKNIVVVGGGHSAINVLLDLSEVQKKYPHTRLNWILRKENLESVYGGKKEDALAARGALGSRMEALVHSGNVNVFTPFHILGLQKTQSRIRIEGEYNGELKNIPDVDEIISNTGSKPNLEMIRELRVGLDPALESVTNLAELIDPNVHSCGTVRPHGEKELRHPEKDFYIIGSKSYGRAPTFLMTTGYEQVRSIVAYLTGDKEAAERVELNLPETGVCSANFDDNKETIVSTTQETVEKKQVTACCQE